MKIILIFFILLALIGFTDSTYLTIKQYQGEAPTCDLIKGCDVVTSSQYATFGPLPIALLGMVYYLTIGFFALFIWQTGKKKLLIYLSVLTSGGFLVSLYLLFLQLFILRAICLYCLLSAVTSTSLFILGLHVIALAPLGHPSGRTTTYVGGRGNLPSPPAN